MHKLFSRCICCILCMLILIHYTLPVWAEEENILTISNTEEFLAFSENCRIDSFSQSLTVQLQADIDLSGINFGGIPIFCGTFLGNRHTISGLNISRHGSNQGLFRYITQDAVIQNLILKGTIRPEGSRSAVGALAGNNAGRIQHCSFIGSVIGSDYVGGLVGNNSVTGIIEFCRVSGSVEGSHFVGGIAGSNNGVIRSCVNMARINTTVQQNSVEISDITLDSITNSEAANTVTDIGGIAGVSSGVLRNCSNRADVGYPQIGYNVGGIVGGQNGYVTACDNYGDISGRKEIGGIAGQLEPAIKLEYSLDTLQILQGQLDELSAITQRTADNAQSGATYVTEQMRQLQAHTDTATEAIQQLLPENGQETIDPDSVLAAQNVLSDSLQTMGGTLNSISQSTEETVGSLSGDMLAIADLASAISQTVDQAEQSLGMGISDVSDEDTDEDLTGKLYLCNNYGTIAADWNVGGIVGSVAIENDLDPDEDLLITGDTSLNFEGQLRAVILSCNNSGQITAGKQNAGGVAGWLSMGLLKNCVNTGNILCDKANYIGGIAGQSSGYIRNSSSKSILSGLTNVGGIAGSAAAVTNCYSMSEIRNATEKAGAILGTKSAPLTDADKPVSGNFYLPIGSDIGGIDGISYDACAQPLTTDAFFQDPAVPEKFRHATVRFLLDEETLHSFTIEVGNTVKDIPDIPQQAGCIAQWDSLSTDLPIYFDTAFHAVYSSMTATITSDITGKNGMPLLLVQGGFTGNPSVQMAEADYLPPLLDRQSCVENWLITLPEYDRIDTGRLLIPEGVNAERMEILLRAPDGSWQTAPAHIDGSYLVFTMDQPISQIALVETQPYFWQYIVVILAAFLLIISISAIVYHKKKK